MVSIVMLVNVNGLVIWSEQWVEPNQAALIVAASALCIAWLGTIGAQGQAASFKTYSRLMLGAGGVALLVGEGIERGHAPWFAYAALLVSPLLWAVGSIVSKRRPIACAPFPNAAADSRSRSNSDDHRAVERRECAMDLGTEVAVGSSGSCTK